MNELIHIQQVNSEEVVSARELYEFLGFDKSQWARWAKMNISENPFAIEDVDYKGFDMMSNGNPTRDFHITLDFAKRLAMMAKTERGEQARQYFLECERRVKAAPEPLFIIPKTYAEALELAAKQAREIDAHKEQLTIAAPKLAAYNRTMATLGLMTVAEGAKVLGVGPNKLFDFLRLQGVFYREHGHNLVYQTHIDAKRFEMKMKSAVINGNEQLYPQIFFTAKGIDFVSGLLEKLSRELEKYEGETATN